jgi:hypothetical protein
MHYFNRKDALADVAGNLLNKTRNQTLAEALYTKNVQGTPDGRGLFYIEDQDNLQAINNFMKK